MRDIERLKTERELVRIKIDDRNAFWKEIEVNTGVLKLMLLSLNLMLLSLSYRFNTVRLNLMLPVPVNVVEGDFINTSIKGFNHSFVRFYTLLSSLIINHNSISSLIIKPITISTLKFAETHNLVAFLEKPEESNGFEEIIDSLNTSSVQYALTVNPTIYTTCIEQFWTSAKAKTVYGEHQIQALVDKTKVIITATSIRSDLKLDDVEGIDCLPTATIFAELERI
ncbi:hypothetical protein Tco_1435708, partial [Tanacetum coccineum]